MRDRPAGDTVAFLTNIPNGFNEGLHDGLRSRGFEVRVRYEGLPASIGRPWALTPRPPDRVAATLWHERDALLAPPRGHRGVVVLGGWAHGRAVQRRVATAVTHRGRDRQVLYWGEKMNRGSRAVELGRRAFFAAPGLDGILAIGSHAVASYREATGGRTPVHVLPYTTDRGVEIDAERPDHPTIGFAGRLLDWKNVGVVIRAIATLAASDRPRFDVVGSGPTETSLRSLADALGVDVRFHGEVSPDEVATLRRSWTVTVQPSRETDGWALAVPESLNSGVPVVASGFVGAAIDLVRDGRNGALVASEDVDDPDAWAEVLTPWLDGTRSTSADVKALARPFLPDRAADWFARLVRSDPSGVERSFVTEAWHDLADARDET